MTRNNDYHLMGKRRFIKALTGLGVSSVAVSSLSKSALAELTDDPEKEVPRRKFVRTDVRESAEIEDEYYTIPRDEWENTQSRYKAGQELKRSLASKDIDPTGIDVVVKTKSGNKVVSVQINRERRDRMSVNESEPSIKDSVPEALSTTLEYGGKSTTLDVPIIVEEEAGFQETDEMEGEELEEDEATIESQYYDYQYRPIPGGCKIITEGEDGEYFGCTGGYRVYDLDLGEYAYVTAAHCFDAEEGKNMGQNTTIVGSTNKVAYSSSDLWGSRMDSAVVEITGSPDLTDKMADRYSGDNYRDNPISGYVTTDWLQDNEDGGATLMKQGITTGFSSGELNNVSVSNDYFTTTAPRDDGDSGGPHFYIDGQTGSGDIYMAGIHRGATSWGNARGIIWENILDEHNLSDGPGLD
ncbi:trypsin-like serine protease [Natronobeatus ordinarius]|uniref:trypsin-like serine protease n=1 Tax=Natronobeatus ordinarius TaxID=2963433 RepID=UPI0020CD8FCA|nr:trypsin-like serine protease [Natronobeatus ordinarius]